MTPQTKIKYFTATARFALLAALLLLSLGLAAPAAEGGTASALAVAAGGPAGPEASSSQPEAVAATVGDALGPVTDIMRAAGKTMQDLGAKAAARLAKAGARIIDFSSQGAGLIVAQWAKATGKSLDELEALGKGIAKAKLTDNALDSLGSASRTKLYIQLGKHADIPIKKAALEKTIGIIAKQEAKWGDEQIESLLRVAGRYGDDLSSGPMKHIDDLKDAEGIEIAVFEMGKSNNIEEMEDVAAGLEYAAGKHKPNDVPPKKVKLEQPTGNGKSVDIVDPDGVYIEYKHRRKSIDEFEQIRRGPVEGGDGITSKYDGSTGTVPQGKRTGIVDARDAGINANRQTLQNDAQQWINNSEIPLDKLTIRAPGGYSGGDIVVLKGG